MPRDRQTVLLSLKSKQLELLKRFVLRDFLRVLLPQNKRRLYKMVVTGGPLPIVVI